MYYPCKHYIDPISGIYFSYSNSYGSLSVLHNKYNITNIAAIIINGQFNHDKYFINIQSWYWSYSTYFTLNLIAILLWNHACAFLGSPQLPN